MFEKRKAIEEKLDAQIKEWSAEIALLKAKAEKAKAEATVEVSATIEALQQKLDAARAKLQKLRAAGPGTWEGLKTGGKHVWDEVKTTVHAAASKFK